MKDYIKWLTARIQDKDVYQDSKGKVRATRDIKKGDFVWMTIDELSNLSQPPTDTTLEGEK